jgi:hypothetical protein
MRRYQTTKTLLIAAMLLSSCKTTQAEPSAPALLVLSSSETRIILEQAIGDLMNSQAVKLADNVFIQKSTVIIDRRYPYDSRGNLLDGREVRQADTVTLLTEDAKCYVRHNQSGNIKLVESLRCQKAQ